MWRKRDYRGGDRVRLIVDTGWGNQIQVGTEGTVEGAFLESGGDSEIVIRWDGWDYGEPRHPNGHWTPIEKIEPVKGPPTEEELAEVYKILGVPRA